MTFHRQDFRTLLIHKLLEFKRSRFATKPQRSYAQEGEDILLRRLLDKSGPGSYVDIGAHHPTRFSNTYHFYRLGWSGLNIDAQPGSMRAFNRIRPRDINVEIGISDKRGTLDFHIFNEPALNSFNGKLSAMRNQDADRYKIVETRPVMTRPLREVMEQYWPAGRMIDFMSIDTEGLDIEVVRSNDWSRFRPAFLVVEMLNTSLHGVSEHMISRFLAQYDYRLVSKLLNSVIFQSTTRNPN